MGTIDTTLKIYNTHIEVQPYRLHQEKGLELSLSRKDKARHCLVPIAYYVDEGHDKLYLPLGVDIDYLERLFRTKAEYYHGWEREKVSVPYTMHTEPRNEDQVETIDFLLQRNKYANTLNITQLGLNLPTGFGKTYCSIRAIIEAKERAMIICHTQLIRDQWFKSLLKHTDVPEDKILVCTTSTLEAIHNGAIDSSDYDFFILLHQSLHSFAKEYSWVELGTLIQNMKLGVRVVDETHYYFSNMLMLDYYTNFPVTFYVTATFGRSDIQENMIYRTAYSKMIRFGNHIKQNKHILSFVFSHDSAPDSRARAKVEHSTAYGFSSMNYSSYIQTSDESKNVLKAALKKVEHLEGLKIVTAAKIDTLKEYALMTEELYPEWRVGVMSSKSDTIDPTEYDIVFATAKMIGTGTDNVGLRVLICMEPMSSNINIKQIMGRLRPYFASDGTQRDTVFIYILDFGFKKVQEMFSRVEGVMLSVSKKYFFVNCN